MEVAVHLRSHSNNGFANDIENDLKYLYGSEKKDRSPLDFTLPKPVRIYIGDEFCLNRLPDEQKIEKFCRLAKKNDLGLTLLTPVLTDSGLNTSRTMFECLRDFFPDAEVVVNDLGVLFYLKKEFPGFELSMGRVFNKGFKDPRLEENRIRFSKKNDSALNDSSFKHNNFQNMARDLDIRRLEQDLLPYATPCFESLKKLKISWYFPFGYVTTGRVCLIDSMNRTGERKFSLTNGCSLPCTRNSFELKHPDLSFRLIQNGNTVFYLYRCSMLKKLIEKTRDKDFRLVYQGKI